VGANNASGCSGRGVITGGLEVCPPKSARGSSAQRIARERTEIDGRCLGPARRQTGTGQRAGHDDDAVFRTERFGIKRQLFKKKVGRERLSPNELFQDGFFGQILNPDGALTEIDPQEPSHVSSRKRAVSALGEKSCH